MISNKGGGSGKYSYREVGDSRNRVHVAHMPEDFLSVRIVFTSQGETHIPIIKLRENEAIHLYAALKAMAEDLNWSDELDIDRLKAEAKKIEENRK